MSSTREKELIKEWAVSKSSRIKLYDRDSFWEKCDSVGDISEYDFQTVPELKKMFGETLVGCEDVVLPLTVAAFKKKEWSSSESKGEVKRTEDGDFSIPEFIYVF